MNVSQYCCSDGERPAEWFAMWHPEKNENKLPCDITPGSHSMAWWLCENGHEWKARVDSVAGGSGCPYCAGKLPIAGETDLASTHPHIAAHWSEANSSPPSSVTAGSRKRVLWSCERGHRWEAAVFSVVADGCCCPYCSGKRPIPGETDLASVFPQLALEWDSERNGTLTPGQLLPSCHEKVWWRCEKGHSYQAAVFSRTRNKGSGCPYCSGKKVLSGFNDLATKFPELAGEWYQPLNGALSPGDVTPGSNKKVWWQCSDGHVWQAAVYSRTRARASGCPVCTGRAKARRRAV